MKRNQRTLAKEVSISGKGLHTGVESTLTLCPAKANNGRIIRLETADGVVTIPINPETTSDYLHRTVAHHNGATVHTIEHILAALAGTWIDNVFIDLTAPEPPGVDGSAKPFVELIEKAGIVELEAELVSFDLKKPLTVTDEQGGVIVAVPYSNGLKLTYTVHYDASTLAQKMAEIEVNPENFTAEIAPSRTFCLEEHVGVMQAAGCGLGANYDNTLVLSGDGVINNELRFHNETARHKLLDLLGDIAIINQPLCMHIIALRSGHALNTTFAKELAKQMASQDNPKGLLDINEIEATLPHRYPFLLVDRILEMDGNKSVVGLKNVTRNEPFFNGHFPGLPVMPGVLQLEALAQTAGVMMLRTANEEGRPERLAVLMSIDGVKYRKPVVPGDQLIMHITTEKVKGRIGLVKARGYVDGEIVTEAAIKFAMVDKQQYR
ncbi:MAG: UDP-3-O-[3-hydroxymyristoyl] N-acetylglucosamine deacetylase [Planctomycetes bacterium]|nr:UDP-3-O-[3-hydroxymyristoyl] N-acetylglucosamine deacetylase [Planctomycetota bacterium]